MVMVSTSGVSVAETSTVCTDGGSACGVRMGSSDAVEVLSAGAGAGAGAAAGGGSATAAGPSLIMTTRLLCGTKRTPLYALTPARSSMVGALRIGPKVCSRTPRFI